MKRDLGIVWFLAVATGLGCGGEETAARAGDTAGGSRNVTQGGAQDIALFRSIVASGEVPSPRTLDPVGFFAEHAVDLPPADCGEDLCLHPMLAVAPRFDGTNWTMAFVAMNSPVDPATLERPPLHLVIALERSPHTAGLYRAAELGTRVLASRLRAGDLLSLVVFDRQSRTLLEAVAPDPAAVDAALLEARETPLDTGTALYDALAVSAGLAGRAPEGFAGASRVLLVTSGHAEAGITDPSRLVGLADALARRGTSLSVIGAGADYDPRIPQAIGELGAGTYAYAEDAADLDRILRFEGDTTMFPLATGFRISIEAAPGYRVGAIYGARRAVAVESRAWLDSPALFLGHRTGSTDTSGGRRGGGGGLFVELLADPDSGIPAGAPAFVMNASWTAADGTERTVSQTMVNTLAPGHNPADMWPTMSHEAQGNVYMMLNMYLTLRAATDFYDAGDCARALGVIDMVAPTVEIWQGVYASPDIWADFDLVLALRDNMQTKCDERSAVTPIEPQQFHGGCFGI